MPEGAWNSLVLIGIVTVSFFFFMNFCLFKIVSLVIVFQGVDNFTQQMNSFVEDKKYVFLCLIGQQAFSLTARKHESFYWMV